MHFQGPGYVKQVLHTGLPTKDETETSEIVLKSFIL